MALIPATQFIHHCYCSLFSPTNKHYIVFTHFSVISEYGDKLHMISFIICLFYGRFMFYVWENAGVANLLWHFFYLRVSAGIKHILKLKLFFGAAVHLFNGIFWNILVFLGKGFHQIVLTFIHLILVFLFF